MFDLQGKSKLWELRIVLEDVMRQLGLDKVEDVEYTIQIKPEGEKEGSKSKKVKDK